MIQNGNNYERGAEMVDFHDAMTLAKSCWSEVDYCEEYDDAYIFSKRGDMSFGGNGPVVVLKATGECINMVSYIDESVGEVQLVREGYIADLG